MFNKNIKIAFFGNSEFSLIVLKELKKNGIIPELIVATPDKPQGRKMILTPTPTKVWAEENSIEYVAPEKLKDESFLDKIKNYNLFIVASYGKIIPNVLIDIPKYKVLNIHPSLLPKYRGPSPLQEQILNDEKHVGVSIMLIDDQVDHGATYSIEFSSAHTFVGVGVKIIFLPCGLSGVVTISSGIMPFFLSSFKTINENSELPKKAIFIFLLNIFYIFFNISSYSFLLNFCISVAMSVKRIPFR